MYNTSIVFNNIANSFIQQTSNLFVKLLSVTYLSNLTSIHNHLIIPIIHINTNIINQFAISKLEIFNDLININTSKGPD